MPKSSPEPRNLATWVIPAVLVACTNVSILSTDLYTPSLPHLPRLLSSDAETAQLTVSLNLAAYAVAHLLHGPLADRYGRRRLLLIGMVGFLFASLICGVAQTIDVLLVGRVAQGVFASVPSVVVLLIIRESFDRNNAARIMGFYGMAIGVTPAAGPIIGGYIHIMAGWRMNFVLLAVLAAGAFLLVRWFLPETGSRNYDAIHPAQVVRNYWTLLRRRSYLCYLLPLAMMFGTLFAFVTAGPFLLIDGFGVATQDYGLYYSVLVVAFMAGGLSVTHMVNSVGADRLVQMALLFAFIGSAGLIVPLLADIAGLETIISSMALLSFGIGLILASGPGCLFDGAGNGPIGPASALVGSLQMAAASLAGFLVGSFHDGSAWPMAVTIAGFTGTGILGYFGFREP